MIGEALTVTTPQRLLRNATYFKHEKVLAAPPSPANHHDGARPFTCCVVGWSMWMDVLFTFCVPATRPHTAAVGGADPSANQHS